MGSDFRHKDRHFMSERHRNQVKITERQSYRDRYRNGYRFIETETERCRLIKKGRIFCRGRVKGMIGGGALDG